MRLQRLSDRLQGAAKQVYNTYSVWHQTVHNDLPVIYPLRAAPFRLGLRGRSWGRFFSGEIEASPTSLLLGNRLVLLQRILPRSHRFTSRGLDSPAFPTRRAATLVCSTGSCCARFWPTIGAVSDAAEDIWLFVVMTPGGSRSGTG